MRILLAEDEKSLARALVTLLKKHHYEADAVYDGAEALAYLQTGNYDAAILDIMMPEWTALKCFAGRGRAACPCRFSCSPQNPMCATR